MSFGSTLVALTHETVPVLGTLAGLGTGMWVERRKRKDEMQRAAQQAKADRRAAELQAIADVQRTGIAYQSAAAETAAAIRLSRRRGEPADHTIPAEPHQAFGTAVALATLQFRDEALEHALRMLSISHDDGYLHIQDVTKGAPDDKSPEEHLDELVQELAGRLPALSSAAQAFFAASTASV